MDLVKLDAVKSFLAAHARVLDRHRLQVLLEEGDPEAALAAVNSYRNPDGGYGWGLEPDLRSATSQPVGAMHAMEVFAEAAPITTARAVELCDWLHERTLPDGGLPFALSIPDPEATSPIWAGGGPTSSSLLMTSQNAAHAHRLAAHQPEVGQHPWLDTATHYCLDAIQGTAEAPHAFTLMFSLRFLDAAALRAPETKDALDQLAPHIPADGTLPVHGGIEGEVLYPLDLSPRPGSLSRRLFDEKVIEADLDRLAREQKDDGGWTVNFEISSPAAALEWRGYATVAAVRILLAHGGRVRHV